MKLQRFLEVSAADSQQAFYDRLIDFANDLDFGLVMAVLITQNIDGSQRFVRVGNTPAAFLQASLDLGDTARDPVFQRLKHLSVPFIYDRDLYAREGAGDLWDAQAPYGYKTGVNVGLHLPGNRHFLLGMDRDSALPRSDTRLAQLLASLQLLAVHAQDAAVRLFPEMSAHGGLKVLTEREREVLALSAQGHSAKVIGARLNISRHTITFHMTNIRIKLNASNKTEAVSRAAELKLI